ncbi:hypothetical protein Tco_0781837 [Tanacetum coccineum]
MVLAEMMDLEALVERESQLFASHAGMMKNHGADDVECSRAITITEIRRSSELCAYRHHLFHLSAGPLETHHPSITIF